MRSRQRDALWLSLVFVGLASWVMWSAIPPAMPPLDVQVPPKTQNWLDGFKAPWREKITAAPAIPTTIQPGNPPVFRIKDGRRMGTTTYTTPGSISFTPAAEVTSINVLLIGGGGGGESAGGGGGGGGGETRSIIGHTCTPGVAITGVVGSGGSGSQQGTSTTFALFSASGGRPGGDDGSGIGGAGGSTGSGGTGYPGGDGGDWAGGVGGGGGGAGLSAGDGSTGAAGSGSAPGGDGGAPGDPPSNGDNYGGGGGGSEAMTVGGSGAGGYIEITWADPLTPCGFVAADNSGAQTTSSYTWSMTCDAVTDGFLALDVGIYGAVTVTALTYNGVAATFIGAGNTGSNSMRLESWGLVNPASGTHTVSVTLSGTANSVTCATQYQGVNQEAPTEAYTSDTATNSSGSEVDAEVTVTSVTDECNVHSAIISDDTSIVSNQAAHNNVSTSDGSIAQAELADNVTPPGSTLMSFT